MLFASLRLLYPRYSHLKRRRHGVRQTRGAKSGGAIDCRLRSAPHAAPSAAMDMPTAPDWMQSEEAKQLGIYFAQTAISWGVPGAVALVIAVAASGGRGSSRGMDDPDDLPPALAKLLGMKGKEPKEFLKIERLNEKLDSYDYSLAKATTSKEAALRSSERTAFARRLGSELSSFSLDAEAIRKIQKAEEKYRKAEAPIVKALEAKLRQVRAESLKAAHEDADGEPAAPAAAVKEAAEVTTDDKEEGGLLSSLPLPSLPTLPPMPGPMGMMQKGMATKKLQSEVTKLQAKRVGVEMAFLSSLSEVLDKEQASALAAAMKPSEPLDSAEVGGGAPDALTALADLAAAARTQKKHVWVLKFFGDVTASQVSSLRQEMTAVLRGANATRGDEVVLILNTGGGTVTGYGLAAAQLTRLKSAGIPLTICVEQVAASGGYMMACVADQIYAAPFAVLGSIGVITEQPNVYERLKKEGVVFSTVTAGKYKRTLTPTKKLDPMDQAKLKEDIEQVLSLFKGFVGDKRPQLDIEKVATGETWYGPDALKNGLVDKLITVDEVLSEHAHMGAEVLSIEYKEEKKSPLAALGVPGGSAAAELLSGSNGQSWKALALTLLGRAALGGPQQAGASIAEELLRAGGVDATARYERELLAARLSGEAEPLMRYEEGEDASSGGDSWRGF